MSVSAGSLAAGVVAVADAVVRSRTAAGPYVILSLEHPQVAAAANPGQFVSVEQRAPGCLLRRPFSILDATDGVVQIGFDIAGDGTAWLAGLQPGDRIAMTGPLGRAYTPPQPGATALLVGGGYGAAPLIFMAARLKGSGVRTHLILGAASEDRLFEVDRARGLADRVTVTTDDGSAGIHGRVTDAMSGIAADAVYACGPMAMLAAVTKATPPATPAQVAVEEFMGCGIGICWTCVVPTHEEGYRRHVRSCLEGPVFDGRSIAWA